MNDSYKIISGSNGPELAKKVNESILDGYTVAGGVCIVQQPGATL